MYAAARLYYDEGLSQQEVADRLNVSRTTVVRLLQMARSRRIVRIQVVAPTDAVELSEELSHALELRRAVVVASTPTQSPVEILVEPALRELASFGLTRGALLGVSWGETVRRIASASPMIRLDGVTIVPIIGGMDENEPRFQTNEIARLLATRTHADVSFLHLPALPSPELRRHLEGDPVMAARLEMWDRLDAALVGVGSNPSQAAYLPLLLRANHEGLTDAVGDVAARYFDIRGRPLLRPNEDQVLAISRRQLQRAGTVLAVAAGPAKVGAIIGAARGSLINVLVTDSQTAAGVLTQLKSGQASQ